MLVFQTANAQQVARHVRLKNCNAYYEYLPSGYKANPGKKYPLILFLHGMGELGDGSSRELPKVLHHGPPKLIAQGKFPASFKVDGKKYSFIVISPQFIRWPVDEDVEAILDYVLAHYRVDRSRIYLTGLSMGGGETWNYAGDDIKNAKKLAAIVPVAGASNPSAIRENRIASAKLPVWAFHNQNDPTVPSSNSILYIKGIRDLLSLTSPLARLTIFQASSHGGWNTAYDPNYREKIKGGGKMNIYEWMLQFSRGGNKDDQEEPNKAPQAIAGNDQSITLPTNAVTLNGTASKDPDGKISHYKWTKKSGPANYSIADAADAKTVVRNLTEGTYVFTLTVTDDKGASASQNVTVSVKPKPNEKPVVKAGNAQSITLPANSVTLDGSGSKDPDGKISRYKWTKKSGPASFTLANAAAVKTSVRNLTQGTYVFTLTVTDNKGASASQDVTISVKPKPNQKPAANAGNAQSITLPTNAVTLNGTASKDPDGKITRYKWTKKSGPVSFALANASAAKTGVRNLTQGTYVFTLTVTDNKGASASQDVSISVKPKPNEKPVAKAGNAQSITLPANSVTLDGSGSKDPDGKISRYKWTKKSGPASFALANAAAVKTSVRNLTQGTYVFTLTVTDNKGASASQDVTISVKPKPNEKPVANAGNAQSITLPTNAVTLNGTASKDPDGKITRYKWTKKSGPASFALANAAAAKTNVRNLTQGTYVFTLTVTDNKGAAASRDVTISVRAAANKEPIASTGSNPTITLPVNSVSLDGSASKDPDGKITRYKWTKKSGPASFAFANASAAKTLVRNLTEGTYVFTLTVTDNKGDAASRDVTVSVKPKPNEKPVAKAGNAQTITLPANSVTLSGSGSKDPDGKIVSYKWEKISGPAQFHLSQPGAAKTTVNDLAAGTYTFRLTVKDGQGSSSADEVKVTVKKPLTSEKPPVVHKGFFADAGDDIVTYMPLNSVSLDGSKSLDQKTIIIRYSWKKISGPDKYNIQFPGKIVTDVNHLTAGTYTFKFTLTNNVRQTVSDTVKVIVKPDSTRPGDVEYTADTRITPYGQLFQYGGNTGSFGNRWSDEGLAEIAHKAGVNSVRLTLPDYFVGRYGYDSYIPLFKQYKNLGLKEMTVVVQQPRSSFRDKTVFPGSSERSKTFANLYESIWDNGENGTPINDKNYFALYIYHLVRQYGTQVRFWEIWNEPDLTYFGRAADNPNQANSWWKVPPTANALQNLKAPVFYYIRMLHVAYEVIKKLQPDDYVTTGSISHPSFLDAILRYTDNPDGGKVTPEYPLTGGAYFDIVSYPCYPAGAISLRNHRFSDKAADAVIDLRDQFNQVLKKYGYNGTRHPQKSFLLTETNIARKSFGGHIGSEEAQRNFIIKMLVKAQKNDITQVYVNGIGEYIDLSKATSEGQLMGLYENLNRDRLGQEKLTSEGITYKTISALLYGFRYDAARTAQLGLSDAVGGAAFRKGDEYRYVLWAKTHTDMSERASAIYTFPASFNLAKVNRFEWNYAVNAKARSLVNAGNITLTGTPAFFSEAAHTVLNQSPLAKAGSNQTITLPVNLVTLNGSASSDPDGSITRYKWSKKSGPESFGIEEATEVSTKVRDLTQGTYVFTLTVTDDKGAAASQDVTITVKPAAAVKNQKPVATVPADRTITLPKSSVSLDGSASSDPDGTIAHYKWSKKSGPDSFTFSDPLETRTTVSNLTQGVYIFTLTVTDNKGATVSADIKVQVRKGDNTASNNATPPRNSSFYADAGDDITTEMPFNIVSLDGSKSYIAKGGSIIQYKWEKIAGPGTDHIIFPGKVITQVKDLSTGTYLFKLTIKNNIRKTTSDTVKVTVKPDAVQSGDLPYTANAKIAPYDALFQYGSNTGSYKNGWSDTSIAGIALKAGVHTIRLSLPDYFVGQYGYNCRLPEFKYYTDHLAIKENTLFVGQPRKEFRDKKVFSGAGGPSETFANLYEPIWDDGANGTPINDKNYFAVYIYNLAKRYGDHVRFWEIWNEPDLTYSWQAAQGDSTRADSWWKVPPQVNALPNFKAPVFYYIRMLHVAYEVIKKLQPDDYVTTGGIGYPSFLDAILRYTDNPDGGKVTSAYPLKGGAYFDVVSYHCYPAYSLSYWDYKTGGLLGLRFSDKAASAVVDLHDQFEQVLKKYGYDGTNHPEKPFILTETNIARKSFDTHIGSEEAQRNFVIKMLVKAQKNDIKQVYIYGIGENTDFNKATREYQLMGLYENLTRDKPGHQKLTSEGVAYKTTSDLLYGFRYDADRTAQLDLPDAIGGAAFRKGDKYRYVLWAKTHTDMSEKASATYTFPASFGLKKVMRYEWDYAVDPKATSLVSAKNIALTGTPAFFDEAAYARSENQEPFINISGGDTTITLPVNSVMLNGSTSYDPDGKIVRYSWKQVSGPSTLTIANSTASTITVSHLIKGAYAFELMVTDDQGATAKRTVGVTVEDQAYYKMGEDAKMWPNPFRNQITINLNNSLTGPVMINIYDMSGKLVKKFSSNKTSNFWQEQFDLSSLQPGVYILNIQVKNRTINTKIIKQNY